MIKMKHIAGFALAAVLSTGMAGSAKAQSIADIAISVNAESGEFSTLLAAADAAGLVAVLDAGLPLTVFAPTDAAFAKLGLNADNVGNLPVGALRNILLYHVALGQRLSGSVLSSKVIPMLNGKYTRVSVKDDGAYINKSKLLAPDLIDIVADNGVIHVIDSVLLPPSRK
jgi:transforming growth factor-beta-induced protein